MKVFLAVQVLSRRVADALTYCKGMNDFQGCDATIRFISIINDVFDVLNSTTCNKPGYKRPFDKSTKQSYYKFFDDATRYISLKVDVPKTIKKQIVFQKKNVIATGLTLSSIDCRLILVYFLGR